MHADELKVFRDQQQAFVSSLQESHRKEIQGLQNKIAGQATQLGVERKARGPRFQAANLREALNRPARCIPLAGTR